MINISSKALEYRQKLSEAGHLHWFHWFILVFSSLLTFLAWSYSHSLLDEKIQTKFERESDAVIKNLTERMALYENMLLSGVGLMTLTDEMITRQQWSAFSDKLKLDEAYPGINGIGVIYNIKPDQVSDFIAKQRIERPDYRIFPEHDNTEFWPITYIEPERGNQTAIGLDIAFEQNRYQAVIKARDTGQAQITGPIVLVQDDLKTPGFLFYAPFYKNGAEIKTVEQRKSAILGVTYAPFIMYKLMDGVLLKENRHIHLKIADGDTLLYSDEGEGADPKPLFKKDKTIMMFGREWLIHLESDLSFRADVDTNDPIFILIGGIMLDVLLLALFFFLIKANKNALSYANKVTEELSLKAEQLEKSNYDLQQFSYVASHDLKSPLNAIKQLASWIHQDCEHVLPEDSKKHLILLTSRTDRMMKLLSDLLSYSRISSATTFDYDVINLRKMVLDSFQLSGNNTNFSIEAPNVDIEMPYVAFDIVLRNLISNAIKHHDKSSGTIIVSYQKQGDHHHFEIQDDGPGIPDNLHDKVMEMFQTLKPRDQVEGSGMGLAIIKKIIEQQKGSIYIKPFNGRGTTFIIDWPVRDNQE